MDKQEFKKKAKQAIDDVAHEIDQLETKLKEAKGTASATVQEKLKTMREQKDSLTKRYRQLEQATEENWETLRSAFDNGLRAFRGTMAQANK